MKKSKQNPANTESLPTLAITPELARVREQRAALSQELERVQAGVQEIAAKRLECERQWSLDMLSHLRSRLGVLTAQRESIKNQMDALRVTELEALDQILPKYKQSMSAIYLDAFREYLARLQATEARLQTLRRIVAHAQSQNCQLPNGHHGHSMAVLIKDGEQFLKRVVT